MRLIAFLLLLATFGLPASASDTTITYQGQLQKDGQPFTGTPDMEFRLYDSLTGGNQIGAAELVPGVPVEDGLFQVELDFGAGAFDGGERYLEIEVPGDTLSPRQKITGAPTAQHALEVAAGSVGSDQIAPGAVSVDELANDLESKWTESGGRLQPKAGQSDTIEIGEVNAVTSSTSTHGYAVRSQGNLEVVGHADVSRTGVSAYLSANQTIATNTDTTVVFDSTNADHFGGYDTSTGQYTVQEDGDYHVSFTIDWQTNFSAGDHIDYELRINGNIQGGIQADTTVGTDGQRVARSFSRTLFGLSQGDTLEIVVRQDSGMTADIWGNNQETYLTIFKAG